MLTAQESLAIHCALVLGLPEPQAAKTAGIPQEAAAKAIAAVEKTLPGRKLDFNRLLEGDPLLMRYEIELARLEYQHMECLEAWRATKEHAQQLAAKLTDVVDEKERPRKPFVGDIRFLQLARQIRREIEKLELAILQRHETLTDAVKPTAEKPQASSKPPETQPDTPPDTQSKSKSETQPKTQPKAAEKPSSPPKNAEAPSSKPADPKTAEQKPAQPPPAASPPERKPLTEEEIIARKLPYMKTTFYDPKTGRPLPADAPFPRFP